MKKLLLFFMSLFTFFSYGQLSEGFEGATFPPTGWYVGDNGIGTTRSWAETATTSLVHAGLKAAYLDRENVTDGTIAEDWLITSQVLVPTNGQLRFYTRLTQAGIQGSTYSVRVSTASQNVLTDFTTIQTWPELTIVANQTVYEQLVVPLTAYVGQNIYIAFVMENDNGDRWLIDNVVVDQQCLANTALAATPLSTTADLSWTSTSTATQWEIEYGPIGFTQGTGTIVSPVTNPYTLTGLSPLTGYSYYVRGLCAIDNPSVWSGPFNFQTTAAPPVCGGNFVDSGGVTADYGNNEDETITIFPTNPGDLVTVTFTFFDIDDPRWDALYIYDGNSIAAPLFNSGLGNGSGPNAGMSGGYWGTTNPGTFTSSAADGSLTFRFISDGSGPNPGWTANITCAPAPTCPRPTALVISSLTSSSASVAWTNNAPSATQWEVIVLPAGSPAPTAASVGTVTSSNPFAITGLTSQTAYDVYVRAICVAGVDLSEWSVKVSFTTQPDYCGGDHFYDNGGATVNYTNNADNTITICPTNPGDLVTVIFNSFDVEEDWDALYVFDGNSIAATQLASANDAGSVPGGLAGGYWGTIIPGPFTSSSPDGCLTFRFRSDGGGVRAGRDCTGCRQLTRRPCRTVGGPNLRQCQACVAQAGCTD